MTGLFLFGGFLGLFAGFLFFFGFGFWFGFGVISAWEKAGELLAKFLAGMGGG